MFEKDKRRVTQELLSLVTELGAEGTLKETVNLVWNVTAEQRQLLDHNQINTLVVGYRGREATLSFTDEELDATESKQDRELLRQKLRKLLEALVSDARP